MRWKGIHITLEQGNAFIYFIIKIIPQIGFLLQRAQEFCGNCKPEPLIPEWKSSAREAPSPGFLSSSAVVSLSVAISSFAAGSHSAGLREEQEEPFLSVGWCEFDSAFLISTDCGQGGTSSASGGERARADEASCSVCSNLCL